jgi:hypothetical protein
VRSGCGIRHSRSRIPPTCRQRDDARYSRETPVVHLPADILTGEKYLSLLYQEI